MAFAVFITAFLLSVYFLREMWRACVSQEFKSDLARLREQRRRRIAARRSR